jgi:hypothetical protein
MLPASHIATTAVTACCPRWGLAVRSSVQLRADAVDLRARLLAAQARNGRERSAAAWCSYLELAGDVAPQLGALEAELAGEHLVCPIH